MNAMRVPMPRFEQKQINVGLVQVTLQNTSSTAKSGLIRTQLKLWEACLQITDREQLARQVVAVPKSELEKREAPYQLKKIAEKKRKAA